MVKSAFFWAVQWNFEKIAWWVARLCLTGRAPLGPHLGHFPVSKLSKSRLVGKVCESTFQPNWNFSIWSSFALSKIKSPKTGQNVPNEAASRQSAIAVNLWMPSSTRNWAHDSSLEISFCLVIIWLIKQVIWPTKLGENWFSQGHFRGASILLRQLYFWNVSKTMTLVLKVKEVFLPWHILDKIFSHFSQIHLFFLKSIIGVKSISMCGTGDLSKWSEMKGTRGL